MIEAPKVFCLQIWTLIVFEREQNIVCCRWLLPSMRPLSMAMNNRVPLIWTVSVCGLSLRWSWRVTPVCVPQLIRRRNERRPVWTGVCDGRWQWEPVWMRVNEVVLLCQAQVIPDCALRYPSLAVKRGFVLQCSGVCRSVCCTCSFSNCQLSWTNSRVV